MTESNGVPRNPLTEGIPEQIMRIKRRPSLLGIILPAHTVKTLEIQHPDPAASRQEQGMNGSGEEKWRDAGNHSFYIVYRKI